MNVNIDMKKLRIIYLVLRWQRVLFSGLRRSERETGSDL